MILRKAALLPLLASTAPATAYFAQVNNAHVEFATTGAVAENADSVETVDDRASLQHASSSAGLWTALEEALAGKSELGFAAPKIMRAFEEWVERFGREYATAEEKAERMLVWLENHVLIETHNAKGLSFTMGHNDFSDMTHAEFRARMRLDVPAIVEGKKNFNFMDFDEGEASNSRLRGAAEAATTERRLTGDADAEGKDWHDIGLMGPVRNQGECGACWAFSAVGSIESAMAIDKYNDMTPNEQAKLVASKGGEGVDVKADLGLVVPLSEQDLIDCDTQLDHGCDGGLMITAFEEEEPKRGICSEVDYPYLQTQGTCSYSMCTPVPGSIVKDHVDIVPRKNNALVEALKIKPVTAAMVASDPMFQFYASGVYSVEGCGRVTKHEGEDGCNTLYDDQDTCLPDINHGVLVVGYGKDETITSGESQTFFKVKNSWGSGWGEGGYFRLARYEQDKTDPMDNWGECAILTLLSYPVME